MPGNYTGYLFLFLLKSFVLLDKNIERSKEIIKEEFWKERKKRNIVSLLVKASSVDN